MQVFPTGSPGNLTSQDLLQARDRALEQFTWARHYTLQLIETIPLELWYTTPSGCVSNVAWQVGHLAVSQYGLMLFRQRGRAPGDMELMPGWLRKQFGRGTQPPPPAEGQPSPVDLLSRLAKIHTQVAEEVPLLTAQTLAEPIDAPYTMYPIKLGALLFAPLHESLHAGQIGLLRRLHGLESVR